MPAATNIKPKWHIGRVSVSQIFQYLFQREVSTVTFWLFENYLNADPEYN